MKIARLSALAATAVASFTMLTAAPAHATDYGYWNVTYGASQSTGDITWYNQSVNVSGALKAVSACKWVEISSKGATGTWDHYYSPDVCPGDGNYGIDRTLYNNEAGGPRDLYITMYDAYSDTKLVRQHCTRSGCEAQHGF